MSKGKHGITLPAIAVIAFILSFFGLTEILVLVTGYALIVESDNWLTKQTLQALYLRFTVMAISILLTGCFSFIINFFNSIDANVVAKVFSTIQSLCFGVLNIVTFALCVYAIAKVIKNNDAKLPIFSQLADKSLGVFQSKKETKEINTWICSCGNSNVNNFCSKCGVQKPNI